MTGASNFMNTTHGKLKGCPTLTVFGNGDFRYGGVRAVGRSSGTYINFAGGIRSSKGAVSGNSSAGGFPHNVLIIEFVYLGFELKFFSRLQAHRSRAQDRKSTRLNSSHVAISYAVFCLKKKTV